jgi:hypothetical protein
MVSRAVFTHGPKGRGPRAANFQGQHIKKNLHIPEYEQIWGGGAKFSWAQGRKIPKHGPVYKTILKPICMYGIPLWGSACHSNIEILQRFQHKVLRTIVNAPWYIPDRFLHTDLQMPTIRDEITKFSTNYRAKLLTHPNELTSILLDEQGPGRLKRIKPRYLPTTYPYTGCPG